MPRIVRIRTDDGHFYVQTASEDGEGHTYGAYKIPREGTSSVLLHSIFERHTDSIEAAPAGFDLAFSSLYIYGSGAFRVPLAGGPAIELPNLFTRPSVFVDDGIIAVTRPLAGLDYEIVRLSANGQKIATLYPAMDDVFSLARGGDDLFWEQSAEGGNVIDIYRGALDGRPPERVVSNVSPFGGYRENSIAADDKFIYYFRDLGDLYRANHDGSEPVRLTSGLSTVRALGDGCSLVTVASGLDQGTYFASEEGGPLVRVSRRIGSPWADADHVYVASREGVFRSAR